jgi:hypothetical protein
MIAWDDLTSLINVPVGQILSGIVDRGSQVRYMMNVGYCFLFTLYKQD